MVRMRKMMKLAEKTEEDRKVKKSAARKRKDEDRKKEDRK